MQDDSSKKPILDRGSFWTCLTKPGLAAAISSPEEIVQAKRRLARR